MSVLLLLYLAGCVVTLCLRIFGLVLGALLDWFIGNKCYWQNMAKLELYKDPVTGRTSTTPATLLEVFLVQIVSIAIEVPQSWVGAGRWLLRTVPYYKTLVQQSRIRMPEILARVRYPQYTNPILEGEIFWALGISELVIRQGKQFTANEIRKDLENVRGRVPDFNGFLALESLRLHGVVDPEAIDEVQGKKSTEHPPKASAAGAGYL